MHKAKQLIAEAVLDVWHSIRCREGRVWWRDLGHYCQAGSDTQKTQRVAREALRSTLDELCRGLGGRVGTWERPKGYGRDGG